MCLYLDISIKKASCREIFVIWWTKRYLKWRYTKLINDFIYFFFLFNKIKKKKSLFFRDKHYQGYFHKKLYLNSLEISIFLDLFYDRYDKIVFTLTISSSFFIFFKVKSIFSNFPLFKNYINLPNYLLNYLLLLLL